MKRIFLVLLIFLAACSPITKEDKEQCSNMCYDSYTMRTWHNETTNFIVCECRDTLGDGIFRTETLRTEPRE